MGQTNHLNSPLGKCAVRALIGPNAGAGVPQARRADWESWTDRGKLSHSPKYLADRFTQRNKRFCHSFSYPNQF
jgi:hypothetical protein